MSTVTYTQVQELVRHVPSAKLDRVYGMILKMAEKAEDVEISPVDFMKLSISERRKLMKNQARTMAAHYKKTAAERRDWQEGNFIDEIWAIEAEKRLKAYKEGNLKTLTYEEVFDQ